MAGSKLVRIPFMTNCKLLKGMGLQNDANLEIMWVIPFQNVIGSFMYAMVCTKLDIAQVVGVTSLWIILGNHIGLQ
jgi:hypothetical protein